MQKSQLLLQKFHKLFVSCRTVIVFSSGFLFWYPDLLSAIVSVLSLNCFRHQMVWQKNLFINEHFILPDLFIYQLLTLEVWLNFPHSSWRTQCAATREATSTRSTSTKVRARPTGRAAGTFQSYSWNCLDCPFVCLSREKREQFFVCIVYICTTRPQAYGPDSTRKKELLNP